MTPVVPMRFFGESNFDAGLGGLEIRETRYLPHAVLPNHEHAQPYLCVVLGGDYEEKSATGCESAETGSLLGHPDGHRHQNRFGAMGGHCLNVVPSGVWLDDPHWQQHLKTPTHVNTGEHADPICRLRRELNRRDDVSALAISAAVFDLLVMSHRQKSSDSAPRWLARIIDLLEADIASAPSIQTLASEAGIHPSHLSRVFRRHLGQSVGDYLRARRLDAAKTELASTKDPIAMIALRTGFADQAHLSRTIRAATGLTPSAYRAAMQD